MIKNTYSRLLADQAGATATEYGLIASLIAIVIVGSIASVGTTLEDTYVSVSDNIEKAEVAASGTSGQGVRGSGGTPGNVSGSGPIASGDMGHGFSFN
jgi:pilus assembly protein Flp/PilA